MAVLDCGHDGEWIIGRTFALCSKPGCDTRPKAQACHKCGSGDLYDFSSPDTPAGSVACRQCGAIRWSATD